MKRKLAICVLCAPLVALAAWVVFMEISLWPDGLRVFWVVNAGITAAVLFLTLLAWAIKKLDL